MREVSQKFELILSWFFIINSIISIITIILERKRPEKTIAWLLTFILFPPLGLILYIFLGRNWKRHKLNEEFSPYVKDLIYRVVKKINNGDYYPLIKLIANNSDSPLFIDNDITIFSDGNDKFNALKEELKKAKHHIHMEYYIVKSDRIGNEIKDILIQKAREGVTVRFIIDRVGSIRASRKYINELKNAGVDLVQYSYFLAPLLKLINTQINYRDHRKIVVIDGKVGFVGGMNIGDEYLGKGKLGYWRDLHIMVKGDFVLGLQAVFLDAFWTIKKINGNEYRFGNEFDMYFPKPEKAKGQLMQILISGPDSEFPSIMHGMLKMIGMAKDHIYITTPYFIPTECIIESLKVAALSGIDVRIVFPGKYDHFMVYYASRSYFAELLKFGIKIYFYKSDSFIHSKVMTIDGNITTVGTANMDIRSYELNYEVNAVIYDDGVTAQFENIFFEDIKNSRLITLEDYNNMPGTVRLIEDIARIFSWLM